LALGTLAVVLVIALRYGGHVSRLVAGPSDEVLLLHVLGFALFVAGAADRLRVSAAVGSFLVGIALSGRVAEGAPRGAHPAAGPLRLGFLRFFSASVQTRPASCGAAD
jgi:monovalent cation:H+ antiporter-2, CPA2 family